MKFGSLFTGIGGFDLGFERAGLECAWQVEIDKHCNELLQKKWPDVERFEDVREFSTAEPVDLICGGFPCQDLSVAGRRAGLDGERSGLWFEFHRVLSESRPAWVVIENVPGLLSSNGGEDLAVVLRGLAELGYMGAFRVLDSQYFGVGQRRKRVFIVGHLGDGRAAEVLFEPEGLPGDPPPSREAGEGVAGTLGSNSQGGFRTTDLDQQRAFVVDARGNGEGDVVNTLTGDHLNRVTDYTPILHTMQAFGEYSEAGGDSSLKERDYKDATDLIVAAPLRSRSSPNSNMPGRGGEDDENLIYGIVPGNSADAYGIGLQEGVSPPVRSGGAGAKPTIASQRTGVRRLTPTECERLQGFPDGWTEGFSDTQRYRMLGNAVTVPVIEWIGKRILEHEEQTLRREA